MAKAKHRPLPHQRYFWAVWNYRKTLPAEILETINGVDHSDFLLEKFQKENNYMSQKSGHKRNLMTVKRLLSRIAKYADKMPQGSAGSYQVHLSDATRDACRGQVFPGVGSTGTHGLLRQPHRLRPP